MAWKLAAGLHISPGQTVKHAYGWNGQYKGPQMAITSPPEIVAKGGLDGNWSNRVATLDQAFRWGLPDDGNVIYGLRVTCTDTLGDGASGYYDIWVQAFGA